MFSCWQTEFNTTITTTKACLFSTRDMWPQWEQKFCVIFIYFVGRMDIHHLPYCAEPRNTNYYLKHIENNWPLSQLVWFWGFCCCCCMHMSFVSGVNDMVFRKLGSFSRDLTISSKYGHVEFINQRASTIVLFRINNDYQN